MVNYDELPLFPLHVVLYPDIPLPLHIFEDRYRLMVRRCLDTHSPFGVVLIESGDAGESAPCATGTTARIVQHEELPDGRLYITVVGETRFRIRETRREQPYLTARVEPFWEGAAAADVIRGPFERASALFREYLKSLFAKTGRSLSALQLPQEPENLSYTIAYILQSPLPEKQRLLEMTATDERLEREIGLMSREMGATRPARGGKNVGVIRPVDTRALGRLSSRN